MNEVDEARVLAPPRAEQIRGDGRVVGRKDDPVLLALLALWHLDDVGEDVPVPRARHGVHAAVLSHGEGLVGPLDPGGDGHSRWRGLGLGGDKGQDLHVASRHGQLGGLRTHLGTDWEGEWGGLRLGHDTRGGSRSKFSPLNL